MELITYGNILAIPPQRPLTARIRSTGSTAQAEGPAESNRCLEALMFFCEMGYA